MNRIRQVSPYLLLLLLGVGVRSWWLGWHPFWADEGYSIYFATEPLARMIALTAADIHPPFYYLLLHWWQALVPMPTPAVVRLFSLVAALPALLLLLLLARLLLPGQRRPALIALLLFALNPLHLFYSQEVRMYGLALTLSLTSTLACCHLRAAGATKWRWWWLYVLSTATALYTLYYTAFLFVAQLLWVASDTLYASERATRALRHMRTRFQYPMRSSTRPRPRVEDRMGRLMGAQSVVALLYLPWLLYVASDLTRYVTDKIGADQDLPLPFGTYLLRHLLAALWGHLNAAPWSLFGQIGAAAALLLLCCAWLIRWRIFAAPIAAADAGAALKALGLLLIIPTLIAFAVNRFYPFFPAGGERLLLFLLPYFLLQLAILIDCMWQWWQVGKVALVILLGAALGGIWTFYTVPHHQTDDYRPLVRQIVQQGRNEDLLLATFPWQVGLWRLYAPLAGLPLNQEQPDLARPPVGPTVRLLSERSVRWDDSVQAAIDQALARGTLWYPGLRSIGSTLPAAVEQYATERALMLVDEWYGETTLQAWVDLPAPTHGAPTGMNLAFGPLQLTAATVTPAMVAAANQPIRVDFEWAALGEAVPVVADWGMTLRLTRAGHTWASRNLSAVLTKSGLLIPAGLPPGEYTLQVGIVDAVGELVAPEPLAAPAELLHPLGRLEVTAPARPLLPARLPMRFPLEAAVPIDAVGVQGLTLLGYSGADSDGDSGEPIPLAGETVDVVLFWQNQQRAQPERWLYLSLLDEAGNGVAGWEGWPLPDYPLSLWSAGALVQTPVSIALPATLATGHYRLGGGLLDPATGTKSDFVLLGTLAMRQRVANFTALTPPQPLVQPAHFGSHSYLLGYALQQHSERLLLELYWQVDQPLLPAHSIFVHLNSASGQTVAQHDGEPQSATGPAPTGSWRGGEYLVTYHQLELPATLGLEALATYELQVGFYLPATGARLPVRVANEVVGDAIRIPPLPTDR